MTQDTGKFRTNLNDQFYTKIGVASECIKIILDKRPECLSWTWIEPSAGSGTFMKALPKSCEKIGIDLEPKFEGVNQGDFLKFTPVLFKKCILFGNPPFGRQGSLAKSFIKHGSIFADTIAFILPRSFVKPSMSSAFPLTFHCIHSEELGKNSFEVNGKEYDVPCVFQIWEKRDTPRTLEVTEEPIGFRYVKSTEPFQVALRRVGVNAGTAHENGSPSSHYFLNFDSELVSKIIQLVNLHKFPTNTTGPRSLSKPEVTKVLNRIIHAVSSDGGQKHALP